MHHCHSATWHCCRHLHWAIPWLHPSLLSCCRPLQAEEEDILREALLTSGTDPEAPVDSSRKRRRSWYSLLGTAITYVWPDSPILQLRAFTCILLILIMRVLNLAVPLLYKKVVDTLASTSEGTHPRPGEAREHYQFWQVCFRCQCSADQGTTQGLAMLGGRARATPALPKCSA